MDGLRWLLLVFGLVVIAAVYFYTRYQRKKQADSPQQDLFEDRVEPSLGGPRKEPALSGAAPIPDDSEPMAALSAEPEPPAAQKIVTVRIIARDNGSLAGDELVLSLRGIGLRHGKFGIFHRLDGSDEERTLFSAASLVEPGSFDLANIKEQELPGISLFMVLPGPVDGAEAFDSMMEAARALASSLDADLLDESGSTLSIQRERYMREEIIQFEHSLLSP
jgi:cell division protein ZipA